MSDDRLRELKRRWQQSGNASDEARLLIERVRQGGLARERIQLCATLGHEAAQLAVKTAPPELRLDSKTRSWVVDQRALLRELADHGETPEAVVRFGVAVARNRFVAWDAGPLPLQAIEAAEAWLCCPCEEHQAAASARGTTVWERLSSEAWLTLPVPSREAAYTAAVVALACRGPTPEGPSAAAPTSLLAHEQPGDMARGVEEVVAWALGYGDPVRMRVAKRGEVDLDESSEG